MFVILIFIITESLNEILVSENLHQFLLKKFKMSHVQAANAKGGECCGGSIRIRSTFQPLTLGMKRERHTLHPTDVYLR